jgi:peroxygenase
MVSKSLDRVQSATWDVQAQRCDYGRGSNDDLCVGAHDGIRDQGAGSWRSGFGNDVPYRTDTRSTLAQHEQTGARRCANQSFFDDNGDRTVDVAECMRGLRALGLPFGVAWAAALAIVALLSMQTRGSLLALSIDIENVQKGKHDSDTGILDKRGRFNARRFDKVFGACSTVDRNGDKAFTATELTKMINANRETLLGSLVSTVEWHVLLALAADTKALERGRMAPALSTDRIKAFYDGTLFYKLAKAHAKD